LITTLTRLGLELVASLGTAWGAERREDGKPSGSNSPLAHPSRKAIATE
jgi:hypothetical protein